MSTFEATQNMRVQQHFEVLEIDLPVITGACTVGSSQGFGTPLTCDQAWADEYKTYYFTNENAPILPQVDGEPIFRCITAIKETATELKPGDGLSSRGSLNITFADFTKQDPNNTAPGVNDTVKNQGTYFGKLDARQVFENKNVRLKLYRVQPDGSVDLVNGAQTRHYVANAFKLNSSTGKWSLECKDVLLLANLSEKSWPITAGGFIRQAVDDSVTAIPVDGNTDYSSATFVRIGDEFLQIVTVSDNLTPTAILNVAARGGLLFAPVSAVLLTSTVAVSHSAGDEVFICDLSDDETIDSLITKVLVDSDFDVSLIPATEWADEVLEWHSADKINTLHSESESVNDVLNRILTGFLMDLWFSTTENLAKLSAISVWKQSTASLTEGKEINTYSIKKTPKESMRASRALVAYDKRDLSASDDTPSYKKASQFSDNRLISPALFSKHKDKLFDNNFLLTEDSANLLTQRYVSRFKFTPFVRTFETEERALTFNTGDVVDLVTTVDQGPDGLTSGNIRSQITKINPKYGKDGRMYEVTAMTYEAAFNTGSEIVLDSPLGNVNLHTLAGAPIQAIELTFVLTNYSYGNLPIRAGQFATGSKIILILANAFDGQASGGSGGDSSSNGLNGGTVYDAQGVNTDIYFSGATPSAAFPVADGYIRAPGGGGAGGASFTLAPPVNTKWGGGGGGGGAGRNGGVGGISGGDIQGTDGSNGDIIGNGGIGGTPSGTTSATDGGDGGGWGLVGGASTASTTEGGNTGGDAGSGVVDNGATVVFFGDTPTRYINGQGSHP